MRDIWRHQPGEYFCVSTKSPWKDHFFARSELRNVEDFVKRQKGKNVYFCPHGFSRKRRRKQFAVMPELLWADLDEVDPRRLKLKPTIAIQSSPGRYVGVWECEGPVSEELNHALTLHVGADPSGWDLTQVLRMPGTINYKYEPPRRVRVLWDDGPTWTIRQIKREIGCALRERGRSDAKLEARIDPAGWRKIVSRLRAPVRKFMGKCPPGNRGKVCYQIAKTLAEYGATGPEIARVLMQSDAWQSKKAEQGERWGQQELARLSKLGKRK